MPKPSHKKPLVKAIQLSFLMSISYQAYAATDLSDMSTDISEPGTSAQTTVPSTTLEDITVYADSYRTTGTKTMLAPDEAPVTYTRIDQDLLQERQADSVNAALRYEPGVTSESRGTVTIFDEYNIRGFKTYSNFYDGLRLPYDGSWNLMPQVDVYATEAVEIVKGSASSLYGYASAGGMVNQSAKTPQSSAANEVKLRLGNQDLKELALDSTGPLTDNLDYRIVALGRKKDGQMQTTEEERLLINPSLEWQASDDISVLGSIYYQDDPEMVPSTPLPALGTNYRASYGKLDSDAYAGDNWVEFSKEVLMPSLTVNWDISDNLQFKHVQRYTDSEAKQRNIYNKGLVDGTDNILIRDAYTTDEEMSNWSTDNQLAYQTHFGATEHNLLFGIDYQTTDSEAIYYDAGADGTPTLDLSQPNFDLIDPDTLPLDNYRQSDDIEQRQLGFYVQDEMQWQDLTVVAGLRHDDFKSENRQIKASLGEVYSDETIINDANETSGRLAAIYNFANGFSPYASYSQSFQPVTGSNFITGEAFKPTKADQVEVGIKYLSPDNATQAALAIFDITQENVVVSDFVNYLNQTQTGEIGSQGFEISANHLVNDWMDIAASYSYTDAEIRKDVINPETVGNMPAQIAKHKATLWADFYPSDKLTLNAGVRYQDGMQIDRINTDELPSVTLVDIGGRYQLNPTWSLGASVSNLFDKTYVGNCFDVNNCWMGPEREMSVSATAKF